MLWSVVLAIEKKSRTITQVIQDTWIKSNWKKFSLYRKVKNVERHSKASVLNCGLSCTDHLHLWHSCDNHIYREEWLSNDLYVWISTICGKFPIYYHISKFIYEEKNLMVCMFFFNFSMILRSQLAYLIYWRYEATCFFYDE